MSNLLKYREQRNLTQEELAEKAGLSVRTIQRIEAGTSPKGYTLKVLAKALDVDPLELIDLTDGQGDIKTVDPEASGTAGIGETSEQAYPGAGSLKLINLSSLPFAFLPPLNIIVPLLIILYKKEKNSTTMQLISIQLLWTIFAVLIFMLGVFIRRWFSLDNSINSLILFGLVLCNVLIILRNAAAIGRKGTLSLRLSFSIL